MKEERNDKQVETTVNFDLDPRYDALAREHRRVGD